MDPQICIREHSWDYLFGMRVAYVQIMGWEIKNSNCNRGRAEKTPVGRARVRCIMIRIQCQGAYGASTH